MVRASYGTGQTESTGNSTQPTITSILEGVLGYSMGRGAQALGQVAVVLKALNPLAVTPAEAAQTTLGNPCGLSQDDISKYENQAAGGTCACMPSRWNFCPNASTTPTQLWTAQKNSGKALGLSLPEAQIYTDYCIGKTVDGIMFVPQSCADGSVMRAVQFVRTTCLDTSDKSCNSGKIASTCGPRSLGAWNLDECSGVNYYTPDTPIQGDGHVINDEPTPNAYPGGSPYVKQFYDVLMCGTQVMDAFQWTRTGVPASQVQWCTEPCPNGQSSCAPVKETMAGTYSNVNRVNLDPTMGGNPQDLSKAVCNLENAKQSANDPELKAIQTYVGCGSTP
jgi:hypothetical protein